MCCKSTDLLLALFDRFHGAKRIQGDINWFNYPPEENIICFHCLLLWQNMDNQKSSQDGEREKRRIRLSMVSTPTTSDSVTTTSQSIRSALSLRLGRRESRKMARKGIATSTQGMEGESRESTQHEESFRAEEEEYDDDDDRPSSHYSLPGAFRVKRKLGSREQIECTLEEGSVESFSTAKTPPVVIPSASLVVQESFQERSEEELPIAHPEPHVLLVTKRHFCICITLSCLMFGGLFTGLLFALWDRHKLSTSSENAMNFNPVSSGTQEPTWNGLSGSNETSPSTVTTSHPSMDTDEFTGSPIPSPILYTSPSPTVAYPSPTVSNLSLTAAPTREFSLTSRPTVSTITPTFIPE